MKDLANAWGNKTATKPHCLYSLMRGGMVVFVRAYDSRTRDTLLRGVAFAKVQLARLAKTRAKAERGRMAETFSVVWFCLIDESKG